MFDEKKSAKIGASNLASDLASDFVSDFVMDLVMDFVMDLVMDFASDLKTFLFLVPKHDFNTHIEIGSQNPHHNSLLHPHLLSPPPTRDISPMRLPHILTQPCAPVCDLISEQVADATLQGPLSLSQPKPKSRRAPRKQAHARPNRSAPLRGPPSTL